MEEQIKPITRLQLILRGNLLPLLTLGFLIFTILTAFITTYPEQIYTGQQFLYGWYIYSYERYRLFMLLAMAVFPVMILRSLLIKTISHRLIVPMLYFFLLVFALAIVPFSVTSHIQSVKLNEATYNLYHQVYVGNNFIREYVLVKCDSLGLLCHFMERWEHKWNLDSLLDTTPLLDTDTNTLSVLIGGEVVYTHPIE